MSDKENEYQFFLRFLKNNQIYKPYLNNMREYYLKKKGWNAYTLNEMVNTKDMIDWLFSFFFWEDSLEGRKFWVIKNIQWLKLCREKLMFFKIEYQLEHINHLIDNLEIELRKLN